MKKTSLYLSDDEAQQLRLLAQSTGRSQAALMREGLRAVLVRRRPRRVFRSMGQGAGEGKSRHWDSDELAERRLGHR